MVKTKQLFLISKNKEFRKLLERRANIHSFKVIESQRIEELSEKQFLDLMSDSSVITLIDMNSIEDDIERILKLAFNQRVVMLKYIYKNGEVYHFLKAGVKGITSFDDFFSDAGSILETVSQNKIYLASQATEKLFIHIKSGINTGDLTLREKQILPLIMDGFTYNQAALKLGIKYETIKSHVRNIYRKLGVHTKGDLLRYEFSN